MAATVKTARNAIDAARNALTAQIAAAAGFNAPTVHYVVSLLTDATVSLVDGDPELATALARIAADVDLTI